jgi:hypothetical protein
LSLHLTISTTYSIELARLLMAAAAEVDVVAKLACAQLWKRASRENIEGYCQVLLPGRPALPHYRVCIQRFGLNLNPWENWGKQEPCRPAWWSAYKKVKHERSEYFPQASLHNALNALAGLFVMLIYAFPEEAVQGC